MGHETGLDLPWVACMFLDLGFGLDWILAGIRIGRDERAGWLFDYTLATVFDVACWADGTEGSEAKG